MKIIRRITISRSQKGSRLKSLLDMRTEIYPGCWLEPSSPSVPLQVSFGTGYLIIVYTIPSIVLPVFVVDNKSRELKGEACRDTWKSNKVNKDLSELSESEESDREGV